jgi:dolichyl-phosphate beta-glucosyltransferase
MHPASMDSKSSGEWTCSSSYTSTEDESLASRPSRPGARTVIVVPCYNEALRFDGEGFARYLRGSSDVHFLLVNDGSSDSTGAVLDELASQWPTEVQTLHLERNMGKAEAVRLGMLAAIARPGVQYVGFWDADLATPLEAIGLFSDVLDRLDHLDIVLGSRVKLLGRTIERSPARHYLGRVFATVASLVLALPVYDTQCGAKLFRVDERTRPIFEEPFHSRWIFDVEVIARHLKLAGSSRGIFELPVDQWRDVGGSKVKPSDFLRAAGEMAQLYRRYRVTEPYRRLFRLLSLPFVRYSGAGAIGTVFHYLLLVLAVEVAGLGAPVGATLGATGGALVNYWLNYHFTFISRRRHRDTLPRFIAVAVLGVAINWLIVGVMTQSLGVYYLVSQIVATLTILFIGFVLNLRWTFRDDDTR